MNNLFEIRSKIRVCILLLIQSKHCLWKYAHHRDFMLLDNIHHSFYTYSKSCTSRNNQQHVNSSQALWNNRQIDVSTFSNAIQKKISGFVEKLLEGELPEGCLWDWYKSKPPLEMEVNCSTAQLRLHKHHLHQKVIRRKYLLHLHSEF